MKKQLPLLALLLCLHCIPTYAQQELQIEHGCAWEDTFIPRSIYTFDSDKDAEEIMEWIMDYTGLPSRNFIIKSGNVQNALAVWVSDTVRVILYGQFWMRNIRRQAQTNWASVSILAHEIGHHLSGHSLRKGSSRKDEELEADIFSGYILYKMGATLEEACAAMQAMDNEKGSETHPPKSARIAAIQNGWYKAESQDKNKPQDLPKDMIFVKGGTFTMGCTSEQKDCESDESPTHRVSLSDYYMSRYELTFQEYDAYCNATGKKKPDDEGWGRGYRPVINISWYDAIEYCNWRSQQEGLKPCYEIYKYQKDPNNKSTLDTKKWLVSCDFGANGYRLPTESEWEYAARGGGKQVLFGNGKNVADPSEMNFSTPTKYAYSLEGIYRAKTVSVSSFSPNELGLYNMSGNVYEWCWDWKGSYSESSKTNPKGASNGSDRVLCGGSWNSIAQYVRVANRNGITPAYSESYFGFRLTRTSP